MLFGRSVMSNSLLPHGLQHTRLPCPSPSPRAYSNSCPLSQWYYPTISSSVIRFLSRLQSFPASGSFPMSQLFVSGGQSIGASVSVLPMNIQGWFPLGLTGWISLQSKGLSRVFSNTTIPKHQFFGAPNSLLFLDRPGIPHPHDSLHLDQAICPSEIHFLYHSPRVALPFPKDREKYCEGLSKGPEVAPQWCTHAGGSVDLCNQKHFDALEHMTVQNDRKLLLLVRKCPWIPAPKQRPTQAQSPSKLQFYRSLLYKMPFLYAIKIAQCSSPVKSFAITAH